MFRSSWWWIVAFTIGVILGVSCVAESECSPGSEGCACSTEGTCLEGFTCLSSRCVDPNWSPPDDDGVGEGGAEMGGEAGGSADNVAACNALIEEVECGSFDLGSAIDCELYADYDCDIADYFDCVREAFTCVDGMPDASGLPECVDLATCE